MAPGALTPCTGEETLCRGAGSLHWVVGVRGRPCPGNLEKASPATGALCFWPCIGAALPRVAPDRLPGAGLFASLLRAEAGYIQLSCLACSSCPLFGPVSLSFPGHSDFHLRAPPGCLCLPPPALCPISSPTPSRKPPNLHPSLLVYGCPALG